jgi:hypothetical protein
MKKIATHAHFISIFAVVISLFKKSIKLWPHPVMIMFATLFAAIVIPPFGLMDPKQFNKSKAEENDKGMNNSSSGKSQTEPTVESKKSKSKKNK